MNCTREWDPHWTTCATDKSFAKPPTSAHMGLVMSRDVDAYTSMSHSYNRDSWKEKGKSSGPSPGALWSS